MTTRSAVVAVEDAAAAGDDDLSGRKLTTYQAHHPSRPQVRRPCHRRRAALARRLLLLFLTILLLMAIFQAESRRHIKHITHESTRQSLFDGGSGSVRGDAAARARKAAADKFSTAATTLAARNCFANCTSSFCQITSPTARSILRRRRR